MELDMLEIKMEPKKKIALIAHDGKKQELIEWVKINRDTLIKHELSGTGTTARLITDKANLKVKAFNSGPLGGDQQIGSRIVEGAIDFVIFFYDPLEAQPHDPDVKALLRVAVVYDIPIANNIATADFLLSSKYMDGEYTRKIENYNKTISDRLKSFIHKEE